MALSQINPLEKTKKPSKLENAAQALGIFSNMASVGLKAYDVASAPKALDPTKQFAPKGINSGGRGVR